MSILIKGMEMPTSCGQCPLHDEDYRGEERCDIGWKKIGKAEEKPDWCPLVLVPPHGRLIDADDFYEVLDGGYDLDFDELPETKRELLRMIVEAPTIIEAEVDE